MKIDEEEVEEAGGGAYKAISDKVKTLTKRNRKSTHRKMVCSACGKEFLVHSAAVPRASRKEPDMFSGKVKCNDCEIRRKS